MIVGSKYITASNCAVTAILRRHLRRFHVFVDFTNTLTSTIAKNTNPKINYFKT